MLDVDPFPLLFVEEEKEREREKKPKQNKAKQVGPSDFEGLLWLLSEKELSLSFWKIVSRYFSCKGISSQIGQMLKQSKKIYFIHFFISSMALECLLT